MEEGAPPVVKEVAKVDTSTNKTEEKEEGKDVDYTFEEDVESENSDEAEVSFITTSTDDSYNVSENVQTTVDKMPRKKQYYLSTQEITYHTTMQKHEMDNDITFEERLALSFIFCKHEIPSAMPPLKEFSRDFQIFLKEFNKSAAFNVSMDLTLLPTLSAHEQNLACMLLFTSNRIRKKAKIFPGALSKRFSHGKNNELNFIVKQVALLLEAIIYNSELNLDWDVTPNCFMNCKLDVHFSRHDFIIYTKDGTEVGTGEIKPYQASEALVEIDRCRIAESCKKQLHQRLLAARSKKELYTYGIMINGNQVQLSALQLSDTGEYNYFIIYDNFLPTVKETYAFMEETLVTMIQLVKFMENSLLSLEEMCDELILPDYSSFLKPTVYMVTKEEPI